MMYPDDIDDEDFEEDDIIKQIESEYDEEDEEEDY